MAKPPPERPKKKPAEPGRALVRIGRPPFEFTAEDIQRIEDLAAVLTQDQIASVLGMAPRTFRDHAARDPRVSAAYQKGRAQAVALVGNSLLARALRGDTTAAIFYLKTQGRWRERVEVDIRDFNPEKLTDQQLERIAAGEDPEQVLSDGRSST